MTSENLQRTTYRNPNRSDNPVRTDPPVMPDTERDMDQYYRPLERIHSSCLHGWGVANGLEVTATLNSASPNLTVQPGVALDSSGQHISLALGGNAEVGPNPTGLSTEATLVPVTASGVVMPTTDLTGDKYLTIQFWETFDSASYGGPKGLFIEWHTPWLQLVDVAGFSNDGKRVVLAAVSFAASPNAGQITTLTQGLRQSTDLPVGSVHLQRSLATSPSAGAGAVTSVEAGVIRAYSSGGLEITVPNASDEIHLERDNGGNFSKVSLGTEKIVALRGDGTESVVIDAEAGNISANNGTISASNVTATGTIQGGSLISTGNIEAGGSVNAGNVTATGSIRGGSLIWTDNIEAGGYVNVGVVDPVIPQSPRMTVAGLDATVNIETSEILRVMRRAVSGVKNHNSAGFFVGAFESGINGRSRLDINVAGTPGNSNVWGSVPDVTAMSLQGDGTVVVNGTLSAGNITAGSSVNANSATIYNAANQNAAYLASDCCAAWFTGGVHIAGTLSKSSGGFRIDHPTAPAGKFLNHSFVESSEMKNLYDGIAVLDANGEAVVELPAWFEPLNSDFRYQLTPLGAPGPNLYIAQEIANHQFSVAGGTPSMRVSWQVTAIRQDAWAKAHPMQVEEEKSLEERGYFLHPELYGAPEEKNIAFVLHPQSLQKVMESKKDS